MPLSASGPQVFPGLVDDVLPVSSHYLSSVYLSVQISPFYKDASWINFGLTASLKTLFLNRVTFCGPGVYDFNI